MAEIPELFAVGEMVIWRDPDNLHHRMFKSPVGPFRVRKVKLVPEGKCNCGGYVDDQVHKLYGDCPYRDLDPRYGKLVRDNVGHWQWVEVEDPTTGQFVPSAMNSAEPSTFSGAWFTHAA